MLRQAEVRLSQGQMIGVICKGFGISEQSYYRWRRDYGGLKLDQAKQLKELERELDRLRPPRHVCHISVRVADSAFSGSNARFRFGGHVDLARRLICGRPASGFIPQEPAA